MEAVIQKTQPDLVVDAIWRKLACHVGLHSFSRWQLAHLVPLKGDKIPVNYRECTTCGITQVRRVF